MVRARGSSGEELGGSRRLALPSLDARVMENRCLEALVVAERSGRRDVGIKTKTRMVTPVSIHTKNRARWIVPRHASLQRVMLQGNDKRKRHANASRVRMGLPMLDAMRCGRDLLAFQPWARNADGLVCKCEKKFRLGEEEWAGGRTAVLWLPGLITGGLGPVDRETGHWTTHRRPDPIF